MQKSRDFSISRTGVIKKCTSINEHVDIPEGVTGIGELAFKGCNNLRSISIPNSVTSIGNSAFRECSNLETINIPDSVVTIGKRAFMDCNSLVSIILPKDLKRIEEDTFFRCRKLSTLIIPDGLTSIGDRAFFKCNSLSTITIPENVTEMGTTVFGYSIKTLVFGGPWYAIQPFTFYECPLEKAYISLDYAIQASMILENKKVKLYTIDGDPIDISYGKAYARKEPKETTMSTAPDLKVMMAWANKKKIDTSLFGGVKLSGSTKKAPVETVLSIVFSYMQQMEQLPAYHKETYKTTVGDMKILEQTDKVAQTLDRKSLLKVLSEGLTPSVEGEIDNVFHTYNIVWGKIDLYAKRELDVRTYKEYIGLLTEEIGSIELKDFDRLAPFCRYAEESSIKQIIDFAERMIAYRGQVGRKLSIAIRSALMLSDTHAAATYLDKYGSLETYAKMRGTTAQALRDTLLSKTDLDANGTMSFDL